ncbi:eukaryotic aspartyl protease family protein, partial [Striga asiatica]
MQRGGEPRLCNTAADCGDSDGGDADGGGATRRPPLPASPSVTSSNAASPSLAVNQSRRTATPPRREKLLSRDGSEFMRIRLQAIEGECTRRQLISIGPVVGRRTTSSRPSRRFEHPAIETKPMTRMPTSTRFSSDGTN